MALNKKLNMELKICRPFGVQPGGYAKASLIIKHVSYKSDGHKTITQEHDISYNFSQQEIKMHVWYAHVRKQINNLYYSAAMSCSCLADFIWVWLFACIHVCWLSCVRYVVLYAFKNTDMDLQLFVVIAYMMFILDYAVIINVFTWFVWCVCGTWFIIVWVSCVWQK